MPPDSSTPATDQELSRKVRELESELMEARRREAATAQILSVIHSSPGELQPVFDAIARSALELCGATFSSVLRFDGRLIHFVAAHGMTPEGFEALRRTYPLPPGRAGATTRAIATAALVEIPDVDADPDFEHHHVAAPQDFKSLASVPMLKDGRPIGTITVGQAKTGRFPETQIALLRTFADQAVIAIENARLFEAEQASKRALQEALGYQTATSEVLSVISKSPTELQPVLRSIATTAARLCDSGDAQVYRLDGAEMKLVAQHGSLPRLGASYQLPLTRGSATGRAAIDRQTVHVHDLAALLDSEYPDARPSQQVVGHRTILATPLLREGVAVGAITLRRTDVRPFSPQQIALLQTFADQAVIAIENTRLFDVEQASKRELQESLEYQTAMGDVLDVISRSPTNTQPVFDAIAQSAARLCAAELCNVFRFDGGLIHIASSYVPASSSAREINSAQPPLPPGRGSAAARAIATKNVAQVNDVDADPDYQLREVARAANMGSTMAVPMLKQGSPIGAIAIGRKRKGEFPPRQIELLRTFADQAVIAIENARLFEAEQARSRELSESLEQQSATAEILSAISSSPTDVQPVFEAIVTCGTRLFADAAISVTLPEGDKARAVAVAGLDQGRAEVWQRLFPLTREYMHGVAILDARMIDVPDVKEAPPRSCSWRSQFSRQRLPGRDDHTHDARGGGNRRYRCRAPRTRTALAATTRVAAHFRRTGRHRHREHAPAERAA